jgi:hypothetical protein
MTNNLTDFHNLIFLLASSNHKTFKINLLIKTLMKIILINKINNKHQDKNVKDRF